MYIYNVFLYAGSIPGENCAWAAGEHYTRGYCGIQGARRRLAIGARTACLTARTACLTAFTRFLASTWVQ